MIHFHMERFKFHMERFKFHMQRFKFIHFMVIELRFFKKKKKKKKKMGKHGQNVEIIFLDIMYILHHNTTIFCILVIFNTFFTLILLKV